MPNPSSSPIAVIIEAGVKRAFASAVDWPGWCRAGRDEGAALQALAAAAPRYAIVAGAAGLELPRGAAQADSAAALFAVVERTAGDATTEFGAPGRVADADRRPLTAAEAERQTSLLVACWGVLDDVVAGAPAALRKGPRGGGRDREAVVAHVVGAETGYARVMGLGGPEPDPIDRAAVAAKRAAIVAVLGKPTDGSPLAGRRWPSRYAARRIAWHVMDHAWEIEDRSEPAPV